MPDKDNVMKNKQYRHLNSWFFAIIMIAAGLLFLFKDSLGLDLSISKLWPLFLLIPISFLLMELIADFEKTNGVLIPLTILCVLMAHFLWHNFFGWEHSARTWPNYILAPGLGLLVYSLAAKKRETLIPAFTLLAVAALFYATIIRSTLVGALILIAGGCVLLIRNFLRTKEEKGGDKRP